MHGLIDDTHADWERQSRGVVRHWCNRMDLEQHRINLPFKAGMTDCYVE